MSVPGRILYLGGARSGKSTAAERRVSGNPTAAVTYIATARPDPDDPEWERRVAAHRARRPWHWQTVQTQDPIRLIDEATPDKPVLVDCVTLWLTHLLDDLGAWSAGSLDHAAIEDKAVAAIADLSAAVWASAGGVVLVSNEVGSGIVPATASGRLFRDLLGRCNAELAAACDEVNLVVAGCVLNVKSPAGPIA